MEEAVLRQISDQIGDLVAMYRLVNRERIVRARDEALGDGTKKKVWEMCDGSKTGSDIARSLKVSPQRISQVLADLADWGIVSRNQEGRFVRRLVG
jgi:hypothetical protein